MLSFVKIEKLLQCSDYKDQVDTEGQVGYETKVLRNALWLVVVLQIIFSHMSSQMRKHDVVKSAVANQKICYIWIVFKCKIKDFNSEIVNMWFVTSKSASCLFLGKQKHLFHKEKTCSRTVYMLKVKKNNRLVIHIGFSIH